MIPDFFKNLNPLEKKSLKEYWVYRQGVYSLRLKVSPGYDIHITYMLENEINHSAKGMHALFRGLSVLDSKHFNNSFIGTDTKLIYIPELSMKAKSNALLICNWETGPNRQMLKPYEAVLNDKFGIDPRAQYRLTEKLEGIQSRLSKHKPVPTIPKYIGVQISEKKVFN